MRLLSLLFAAALALAAPEAVAQSSVLQAGTPTGGHAPMYSYGSGGQAIIRDSGAASGGAAGTGLNELLLQILGTGTAPYANAGTGPLSTNNCNYDAPTTNSTGYHYLCSSPNAQGGGLIAYGAGGAASALPFKLIVNGETITLGGSGWLSTLLDSQFSSTQGAILYRGPSAWAALAPGASGTVLKSGGASGNPSWGTTGGVGTVTSITCGVGLTGGIITSTGTCDLTVPVIIAYGGTGTTSITNHAVVLGQGTAALATAAPGIAGTCLASNGVGADPSFQSCPGTGTVAAITAGNGITLAPNPIVVSGTVSVTGAAGQILAGATPALTAAPTLGVNATTSGTLGLANGGALGATVTIQNNSATSAYNWNLPATAGSSGNILASAGGGSSPMTWYTTSGSGTVLALTNSPSFTTPAIGAATGSSLTVTGQLTSTVATGTAPLVVSSTTVVANLNASTLTGSAVGTSGATIPLLSAANTWSGVQSHNTGTLVLKGSVSGTITINAPGSAGTNTITFPAGTTDFSATGGTGQFVKQNGLGAAFTVATIAASDLSNGTTGSGSIVLATSPTITGTGSITGGTITASTAFRSTDFGSGSAATVNLTTTGGTQVTINNVGTAVNFWALRGSATGNNLLMSAEGTDSAIGMEWRTKSTGTFLWRTNTVDPQFAIAAIAGAVNFTQVQGGTTGNAPIFTFTGSDSNVGAIFTTKGTNGLDFYTNSTTERQFSIERVASSSRYPTVGGSNGANPYFGSSAGGIDIKPAGTLEMSVAASGVVKIPNLPSSAAAQTGYVCYHSTNGLTYDGGATCLVSSARFKHDIRSLNDGALGQVMKLRPVSYFKNVDGDDAWLKRDPNATREQIGLVAEEVATVDERLVALDHDGRPLKVNYELSVALLVKAIQEQQAEIDTLKAANDNSWWGSVKRAVGWR